MRGLTGVLAAGAAWPDGRVSGLRARGGFEVDLTWKQGALERATIRSLLGQPLRVRRGNTLRTFDVRRGATLTLAGDDLQQPSAQAAPGSGTRSEVVACAIH